MGKILGLIFGSIVLGPVGALLGFVAGFAFDSLNKFDNFNFSFGFDDDSGDQLYEEAFPILAAYLSRAGGVDKKSVLVVKETVIKMFGVDVAKRIMKSYKRYTEEGVGSVLLRNTCDTLIFSLTSSQRLNFFLVLVKMFRKMKSVDRANVQFLVKLSRMLHISQDAFAGFNFNQQDRYQYHSGSYDYNRGYQRIEKKNPYQVFQISRDATNEQIKKQYRRLSKQYHPDITLNLPENERDEAQKKMREVNSAYEQLKKERSFN